MSFLLSDILATPTAAQLSALLLARLQAPLPVGAVLNPAMFWRGQWVTGTAYALNDGVAYTTGGVTSSYLAVAASTSIVPGTDVTKWVAIAGAQTPAGFPVTDWEASGAGKMLTDLESQALSDLVSSLLPGVASGGLLDLAATLPDPGWLRALAHYNFAVDYLVATSTAGTITLTATAGASATTYAAGALWFVFAATGNRYYSTSAVTIVPSGSVVVQVRAENADTLTHGYRETINATLAMVTPLPGVTPSNPGVNAGDWRTATGSPDESNASLVARCKARFLSLSLTPTRAVYELYARTGGGAAVTQATAVPDLVIPGQVDIYIAGNGVTLDGTTIAKAQAYVNQRTPQTDRALVLSPPTHNIVPSGTVSVPIAALATSKTAAQIAVNAYIASVPIGGTVRAASIVEILIDSLAEGGVGVTDAVGILVGGLADVVLGPTELAIHSGDVASELTWVGL